MTSAPIFIEKLINERKIVLFSKTYSPECQKVKEVLALYKRLNDYTFFVLELEKRSDCSECEDYLWKLSGQNRRQVPLLFIKGTCLGAYDEIVRLHEQNQLKYIFAEALAVRDAMAEARKNEEVVVTLAKIDRTEVIVSFHREFALLPILENAADESRCCPCDQEGRLFEPWLEAGKRSGSIGTRSSIMLEASTSLQKRRDSKSQQTTATTSSS